jgi:hypothetical protein
MGSRIVVIVVEHASCVLLSCNAHVWLLFKRTSATQFGTAAIYEHGKETNQPPRGQEL